MLNDEQITAQAEPAKLGIAIEHARCVNFALQQNGVRFVRRISLTNRTDADLEEITVRATVVSGAPEGLAPPWEARIARIAPGTTYNLAAIDIALSPALLGSQTEREAGELRVEASARGEVLSRASSRIDVLAATEWGGGNELPEILAAFVTPNHPSIEQLLAESSVLLGEWTGDGAITGYQSKRADRARAIIAAIYTAMLQRGIGYINPPASFETSGQKVRLADQVLDGKLGTCLDIAVVLAAAIEQAGLHPLLIVQSGHAFVGAWLVEEAFSGAVIDSHSRIINRVELGEIVVIEAVGVTGSPPMSFDDAARRGRTLLADHKRFAMAIDVHAARRAKIRPLPLRTGGVVVVHGGQVDRTVAPASLASEKTRDVAEAQPVETPRGRVERWKRRLLDLSLRNRLINFRETSQSVVLECPNAAALENALASGKTLHVFPKLDLPAAETADVQSAVLAETRAQAISEELRAGRVRATVAPAELAKKLTSISREAKLSIDENGANTLFLALGSLIWQEPGDSRGQRTAPLILVPVTLERRSINESFRIVAADEEPRINITLVEKLAQEFEIDASRLRELPEDDAGVDVALVLRRFREAIVNIDGWEVRDSASLGLFTFSKFLMWLDLQEREEDLRRSRVVTHLVDRAAEPFEAADQRADVPLEAALTPLDADSSQLAAVAAATEGRTFVLEGPPGTGKSQTITNIIAGALAAGKRVLFVAEKMAALSVVRSRLERVGLGPFCLEVHSNKASKREVLDQIARAFQAAGTREPDQWRAHAEELTAAREHLNAYVAALHKAHPLGRSVYDVASESVSLEHAPEVPLSMRHVGSTTAAQFEGWRQSVQEAAGAAAPLGDLSSHPLREIGRAEWRESLPSDATKAIDHVQNAVAQAKAAVRAVLDAIVPEHATAVESLNRGELEWLMAVSELLQSCPGVTSTILREPGWSELRTQLETLITRGEARDAARSKILTHATEQVFDLNLEGLIASLRTGHAKPWPFRWFACRSPRRTVQAAWKGALPETPALVNELDAARRCRDESRWLASGASGGDRYFGRVHRGGEADWIAAKSALQWATRARELIAATPAGPVCGAIAERAISLASTDIDRLHAPAMQAAVARVLSAWKDLLAAIASLDELLLITASPLAERGEPSYFASARATLARWRAALPELDDWCHWRRARSRLDAPLHPLAAALEAGDVAADQLVPGFRRAFAREWTAAISDATPELREFNAAAHESLVERFRALDRRWLELSAQLVAARVASHVPPAPGEGGAAPTSEMGVLAHQLRLQRRHMPVRRLIGKLPNLLPLLKPCFLMSPLSVAQYLDPAYPPFDLVVFDEASQIPVWDAIGAIARGTSVVVVGDSKQLPPTNFFQKMDTEDGDPADEDDLEELESVLDECVASGLPSMRLLWHYRSRHESLIAFSNHHYYQGRLLTFPVPQDRGDTLGVSLRRVPGVYDRGRTRTNRVEAEAIVAELVKRLTDPEASSTSIGVVTFSRAQQTLIEDLLDAARRADPALDAAMNGAGGDEPVFIKNLENVQGDERDIILFSVCYAPDAAGQFAMNFGPLNLDGGERRLNVAVTRARRQVIVFSSIRADQIDLARTQAVGAAHLKSFLEYAERGPAAIGEASDDAPVAAPLGIEDSIRRQLESRGYTVDTQVGCSAYRIDLAVRDTDQPGRYLIGIECDGRVYAAAGTARDRDRLRRQVLESLGWRMHRVWSGEWRRNRARAMQKIERAIEAARQPIPEPVEPPPPPLPTPQARSASLPSLAERLAAPAAVTAEPAARVYEPCDRAPAGEPDDFHKVRAADRLLRTIRAVLEAEGPIVRDLLTRRVASLWGIDRVTTRVEARIAEVLAFDEHAASADEDGLTLWASAEQRDAWSGFRVHGDSPEARREPEHLPTREIAEAAAYVLRTQISLAETDLIRHTAAAFGFARPSDRITAAMRRGITDLAARGGCRLADGRATLPRTRS